MLSILIKFFHLFCIFYFGINALPVISNTSSIQNSMFDLKPKAILLVENAINQSAVALNISSIISNIQVPKEFNITQIAKDLKNIGIDNLKDEEHIEGLPLDRHGKINPDFHREIFLGNHELFEAGIQYNEQKRNKKLEEIFYEADLDHDKRLSREELLNYVFKNVQQHLKQAKDKNSQLFILIDTNQNGKVTWQEYATLYIKFHNMNSSDINNLDNPKLIEKSFDENLQKELLKIRFRWTEADSDKDNELNLDEFLKFRHPEIAGHSYQSIVNDILSELDLDNDQKIKKSEFMLIPENAMQDNESENWVQMNKEWVKQHEMEFHEMDEDNDGSLTRDELLKAYDPMNRVHINIQIQKLFLKVDDYPQDDSLSFEEILQHADVFTDMRILDTEQGLHDEM